jgi:hypothetical protein
MYYTFKNPFYPSNRRLNKYIVVTIVFALVSKLLTRSYLISDTEFFEQFVVPLISKKE